MSKGSSSGASTVPVAPEAMAAYEVTAPWFGDRQATEDDVAAEEDIVREAFGEEDNQEPETDDPVRDEDEEPEVDEEEEEEDERVEERDEEDGDFEPEYEPELPANGRANKRIRQMSARLKERDQVVESLKEELRLSRQIQEQHLGLYQQQWDQAQRQRQEFESQERRHQLKRQFLSDGLDVDHNPAARRLFDMFLQQQELADSRNSVNEFQSTIEFERQTQAYYNQLDNVFSTKLDGFEVDKDVREWLRSTAIDKARLNQLTPELAVQAAFHEAQRLGIQPTKRAPKRKTPSKTEVQRERISAKGSATVGRKPGETRGGRKPASTRSKRAGRLEDQIFPEMGKPGQW